MTTSPGPGWAWRDSDLVVVSITALLGLIAIIAAWFGASGSHSLTQQAMWLNLAVAGFAVSSVGLCLWLMRGRRAIGERRVALVSLDPVEDEPASAPVRRPAAGSTASFDLVRAPGMRRVHDPACPLVAGKPVERANPGDGEPCAVCAP